MKTPIWAGNGICLLIFLLVILSCNSKPDKALTTGIKKDTLTADSNRVVKLDTLTPEQQRLSENALKGLTILRGLEVHTIATEPMLKNPTNIDVDERGRIWVTEAYNYRPAINGNPTNPLGDRIMILEDRNGDGTADTGKIFYQGPEINAPLGICVLGNKVIVSQSPYVWAFYDDDGDDKADRKEIMFQGIQGEQHDHGAHAFTFGPDGKLYFNFGNEGKTLKDKNGKDVRDQDGDVIGPEKYKQGIVLRCDPDGSNVECLGQNFRNPYEVAVDSYGGLWQSDNDDDGNRGVRINYVMEYGNYGYTDEMTGAGWRANRTNIEDSIPERHWHLNDPGAIPNLLQTGAGSPTGMVIYEGSLLPSQFHDQMIHSDAGPNVVRSYPVRKSGAGYTAEIINIFKGEKDQWFRPADVCVAPDGSLIVADWYDPGVGGHQAGDQTRGRIYRVAPAGSGYTIPKQDYSSPAGAVAALQNPNLSVRYHAWRVLQSMGDSAVPELKKLWTSSADTRMRARAFWALIKMSSANTQEYFEQAVKDPSPDIRVMAIRASLQLDKNNTKVISELVNDIDPQVKRQCALSLRHNKTPEAAGLWARLASDHDGKDRWYLEALGIGADNQWDRFFPAYVSAMHDSLQGAGARDIIWRARTEKAVPYIAKLAADRTIDLKNRLRYFRAFDFNKGTAKYPLLLGMLRNVENNDTALNKLVLRHLDVKIAMQSALAKKTLREVLRLSRGTDEYIELVTRYEVSSENNNLLKLALSKPNDPIGKNAADLVLRFNGIGLMQKVMNSRDTVQRNNLVTALGKVGSTASMDFLQNIALSSKYSLRLRRLAARTLGRSGSGEDRVLQLLKNKRIPRPLVPDAAAGLQGAWRLSVRKEAAKYLPKDVRNDISKDAPSLQQIMSLSPNAGEGLKVFTNTCIVCHKVNTAGYDYGPGLTEIGSKLPPESLYDAIIHPSAGISFGYEGWDIKMKDGSVLSGIIASKTETDIDLKFPGGATKHIKTSDVKSMNEMKTSMMPEGLYSVMSTQDLANLLEYLKGLKKK
ncbi:MAG: PVC-type heme-binding CxxCH protein [Ginsengibacter sp.]